MWQVALLQLSTVGIQIVSVFLEETGRQKSEVSVLGTVCECVCVSVWEAKLTPKNAFVFPGLLPFAGRGGKTAALFSVSHISPCESPCLSLHVKTISLWSAAVLNQRLVTDCVNTLEAEDSLSFLRCEHSRKEKKKSQIRQQLWMIQASFSVWPFWMDWAPQAWFV